MEEKAPGDSATGRRMLSRRKARPLHSIRENFQRDEGPES